MIPPCYVAGWERRPHTVCGLVLRPLTLAHARVLYLSESPYVLAFDGIERRPEVEDLLLAVAVCSRDPIADASQMHELLAAAREITVDDVAAEHTKMIEYMDYWVCPHPAKSKTDKPPATPSVPWPWQLASFARQVCGVLNPWDEIVSNVLIELAAFCDRTRRDALMSLDEYAFAQKLKSDEREKEVGTQDG